MVHPHLPFSNAITGAIIQLSQFATVTQSSGPSVLERKDRRTSVTVKSNVLGTTTGEVVDIINQSLIDKPLPAGIDLRWTGDAERQSESFGSLAAAIVAALLLMYLVMVALYDYLCCQRALGTDIIETSILKKNLQRCDNS